MGWMAGSPIRLPYPGEAGERNNFRGDGYFDIDSGLSKTFKITESQGVKFAWEVFNVTNSARFDTNPNFSLGATWRTGPWATIANSERPRVMQFSLRYGKDLPAALVEDVAAILLSILAVVGF